MKHLYVILSSDEFQRVVAYYIIGRNGAELSDIPLSLVEQCKYTLEELFYAAETGAG